MDRVNETVWDAAEWWYRQGKHLWEWVSSGRGSDGGCDALFVRVANDNATALEFVFRMQRDVAAECRRSKLPCIEAIAAMRCITDDQRAAARRSLCSHLHGRLRDALVRVHTPGWCARALVGDIRDIRDIRGLVELAGSPAAAADAVAHLAELDRLAAAGEGEGVPAPLRALAAREAREVRGRCAQRLEKCLADAAAAAAPPPLPPLDCPPRDNTPEEAARGIFELGYVERLWRGIEHLLPEGVEECGRMPFELERIGSACA